MAARPVKVRLLATEMLLESVAPLDRAREVPAVAPEEAATTPDETAVTSLVSLGVFD